MPQNKIITYLIAKRQDLLIYGLIGVISSLALFLVFYWSLLLNASINNLIQNFYGVPLYFWPYVLLTIGTLVLFGINVPLLVYRWRKYGFPRLNKQAGGGLGAIIGTFASACPVCGSTLLSAIGIAGGLTVFPLAGLELKALSFGLMALPLFLTGRELKWFASHPEACPIPKNASFKTKDKHSLLLRNKGLLFLLIGILIFLGYFGWKMLSTDPIFHRLNTTVVGDEGSPLYREVVAKVLPEKGFQSKIYLGNSVPKLVENGVIDKQKFEDIYKARVRLPPELSTVLTDPSYKPILLTKEGANYYVNLLWPLGLSNYMSTNRQSPINGESLFNFASTGGWNLGEEENGGAYFNKFRIVELTPDQEALVTKIAKNTYRPCCNNSTFYQDCNHGSALLGLIQLGASQGLNEDELYQEALAFNSFWFPHNYIQTALYFKVVKNTDWENVDSKEVLGYNYSAISGWAGNVQTEIAKIPKLLPQGQTGGSCGV